MVVADGDEGAVAPGVFASEDERWDVFFEAVHVFDALLCFGEPDGAVCAVSVVVDEECLAVERGVFGFPTGHCLFTGDFVEAFFDWFVVLNGFELAFVVHADKEIFVGVRDVDDVEEADLVGFVVDFSAVDLNGFFGDDVRCFFGGRGQPCVLFEEGVDADAEVVAMCAWVGFGDERLCFSFYFPGLWGCDSF